MKSSRQIISPMGTGNGAFVIHKLLESRIPGYRIVPYSPYRTLFPPSLLLLGRFQQADLIHTTPDYAYFYARKNIPLILTFHGYSLDRYLQDFSSTLQNIHCQTDLKLFTKLALRKADMITAVSHFTANLVKQEMKPAIDIRVIYNGIDHHMFTPKIQNHKNQSKNINVLFCGKLTRRKGAHWLVPIAERLGQGINILYTSGLQPTGMFLNHPQLRCIGSIPYQQMPGEL